MFTFNREISLGNILTSVSLLIGLATFLHSEFEKRAQVDRAFAAELRDQIGRGQSEAVRLDSALRLFFLSIEPIYVTTSQMALDFEAGGPLERYQQARDFQWQAVSEARSEMERQVLGEMLIPGGLAIVGEAEQAAFETFRQEHARLRLEAFARLNSETQLALKTAIETAEFTAQIGGALRGVHNQIEGEMLKASEALQAGLTEVLTGG